MKVGSPQASSSTSLHLSDCAGSFSNISVMVEATAPAPDFATACPVPGTTASPKQAGADTLTHANKTGERPRGNENNINRRNSFQQSKQPQQTKLAKRRNTANSSFKHPAYGKRRRRANSESDSVLPTNFLLGGNIFDPLNLNSLLDEDVNRALNAETPKSSPLPAKSRDPVEILIPRDITDPLNLNSGIADSSLLVLPYKSGGRRRHRNRHHGGGGGGGGGSSGISTTQINLSVIGKSEVKMDTSTLPSSVVESCSAIDVSKESDSFSSGTGNSHEHSAETSASCQEATTASVPVEDSATSVSGGPNQHVSRRKRRRNSGKLEPPVTHSTPTGKSGCGDRSCSTGGQRNSQSFHTPRSGPKAVLGGRQQQHPHNQVKEQQKKKFQYGNYNKYYGYRNPGANEDPRVHVLLPEWFEGKDVLDLGCNAGHLTLYIAKMLRPARILGLDIDHSLVRAARKNIRHYLSELQTQESRRSVQGKKSVKQDETNGNDGQTGEGEERGQAKSGDENVKAAGGESSPAEAVNDNDWHTNKAETQRQDSKAEEITREDCESPPADQSVGCTFPVSLRISRGPIAAPPLTETSATQPGEFPSNVSFIKVRWHPLWCRAYDVARMLRVPRCRYTSR